MSPKWDLTAYNRSDQLVLIVEVKNKLGASPEWAAQLRRNIFAHGTLPNAPYFLMVLPDRFYLWKHADLNHEEIEPTYIIDARPILQPYLEQSGITADQISGPSLELIISSWLTGLIYKTPEELDASHQWLIDSGLYDAVVGGKLGHGVLV